MGEQITMIKGWLEEEKYWYKIYVDTQKMDQSYEVGDRVFLE